jgi:AraC-like DNA-binding protein
VSATSVFPAGTLLALIDTLAGLGLERSALLRAAGVDPELAAVPGAVVPSDSWAATWSEATTRGGTGTAIRAGLTLPLGAFGLIDYLVGSAPTLGDALEVLVARFGGIATLFTFSVDRGAGLVRMEGHGAAPDTNAEFTLAVLVRRVRELAAAEVPLIDATLPGARSPEAPQELLLGLPVLFGACETSLRVAPRAFCIPSRSADPGLFSVLEQLADRLDIGPAGPHFEAGVRACVRAGLAAGAFEQAQVARHLGMSERTLGRRLEERGLRFRGLVDEVRMAEAERLLRASRPVAEVAEALGYAEQSAFSRAFRRWKGEAPRTWAKRVVAAEVRPVVHQRDRS